MMVCPNDSIRVTGRGLSPSDLVPLPPSDAQITADALAALMLARRSIRRFGEQDVAPELLERIVAMAQTAPMGIPPWDVGCVVVRGRQQVQALASEIVKGYAGFQRIFRPWVLTLLRPFLGRTASERFRTFLLPLAAGGGGGLTMSLEGGLEELEEFFKRRATWAVNWSMRAACSRIVFPNSAMRRSRWASCASSWAIRCCCCRMICW
jgi:hypothetical protein